MLSEIKEKILSDFTYCRISLYPRSCNSVTDYLSALGMNSGQRQRMAGSSTRICTTLVSGDLSRAGH
jgi:hypothetical protein